MKASFKIALKYFKYLFLLFTIIYWPWVIIDDWIFIEKYWATNHAQYIAIWLMYFAVFVFGLSIYYWGISAIIILLYHKVIQPIKERKRKQ